MSSPSFFINFKNFAPGEDSPSHAHQVRSRTGSGQNGAEANPFSSVSDGFSNMEIDNDICYVFGSSRIDSKSNFNSGGHHMGEGNVVSKVCMESEKVETSACNVAKCQGDNVTAVYSSNSTTANNCGSRDRDNLFASGFEDMKRKAFRFSVDGSSVRAKPHRQRREKSRTKNKKKVIGHHDVLVISPNVTNVTTYARHESLLASERSCCLKRLSQCYSDRAAARVSLGRIREALADALMAIQLDPGYPDDRVRAANCHLLLGEVDHSLKYFNECLESETVACLDRRVVIDCVDGIKKAHKVAECTNRSASLLEKRTADAALSAFGIISEALCVSTYSEKLLEMKADTLNLLRRYEEAIQVCEQSINFAEINSFRVENMDGTSGSENYLFARLWRLIFISKTNFQLGRYREALCFVEQVRSMKDEYGSKNMESSMSAAVTISELLNHKIAGNEAFKAGRYTEAAEHYTTALSSNIGSRPFAAICLCNRAAAHQALCQIMDAIADCSLAIALDENYGKAVSRRATLHEMIRDYVHASSDVQRLVSILEKQSDDKAKESTTNAFAEKLQQARRRLPSLKEKAKKGIPLNFKFWGLNHLTQILISRKRTAWQLSNIILTRLASSWVEVKTEMKSYCGRKSRRRFRKMLTSYLK
ncbi:hypothetical protein ACLB2K_012726 [Fragaria x ananassa]